MSERSTHILSLAGGFESVWTNRFAGKVRNQCRAAERRGVEIRVGKGAADFEAYYPIYMASVSRWGRDATSYPLGLFRALAKLAGKGVELKLAMVEGRVVGGVLLLHGRRNTLYWGSAMLKEYSRYSPMNAVLRSAIEEACEKRMEWFDFGASDKLDSVRTFKESFGALPRSYKNYALTTPRCRAIMQLRKALAAVV
ncbi:MAG: GNAT family N-acetyltransferase [Acidobacteriota bacterium]